MKKSRKIYFPGYRRMTKCLDKIIQLQGFNERNEAYEIVQDLQNINPDDMSGRFMVRHRLNGKQYYMQIIDDQLPFGVKLMAQSGSKSLIFCTRERLPTIAVVDQFISYSKICYVYEIPKKKSLR